MSKNLFITGTGTDIGKTFIAGLILKKLRESGANAAYYKAAMSGNARDLNGNLIAGDAVHVKNFSGIAQPVSSMCPFVYERALSPHLAARLENNSVNIERVIDGFKSLCAKYDYITIEGSGGVICPIKFEFGANDAENIWLVDLIKAFEANCLLVADAGLGTINYVGLTAAYLKSKNILLKGIIFNNFEPDNIMHEDNLKMCEYVSGVKVIACVKRGDSDIDISAEKLKALYSEA